MTLCTASASLLTLLIGFCAPAHATSFADALRDFVLGAEAKASVADVGRVLDSVARGCLQCHDGSVASHVSVKSADSPLQFDGFRNANHPVGMRYDDHYRRQPTSYRARALLDPNITLIDGMVSCVSCHRLKTDSPTRPHEQQATLAVRASCSASSDLTVAKNLCMACHTL